MQAALDCLTQCIRTLQYEPEHQAEGKLAAQAREEKELLENFMETF